MSLKLNEMEMDVLRAFAAVTGHSLESLLARAEQDILKRRNAAARANAKFAAALNRATPVQQVVMDELERQGYTPTRQMWVSRRTSNIARTFHKKVWDSAKGRLGTKLVTVYPDGTRNETFERSISIRKDF